MSQPSPIDVVLGPVATRGRARGASRSVVVLATVLAMAVHAAIVWFALRSGPSLEAWSAELALEVHEALVDDQVIELATPPPPPVPEPAADAQRPPSVPSVRHAPSPAPAAAPAAPAVIAADAVVTHADAPLDLTGATIVTGSAGASAAGSGPASSAGAPAATSAVPTPAPTPVPLPVVTRPVQLDPAQWHCAWPREAIAEEIYEQSVVLRVVVLADGRVQAVQLIDDPGHGFGPAAIACARRTQFTPAQGEDGKPIRALSPPIRVRFTR